MPDTLNIALAANDGYVNPLKVVIASLFAHKQDQTTYHIYLLARSFSKANEEALRQLIKQHDKQGVSTFTLLPISDEDDQLFPLFSEVSFGGGWGKESLYRLLLPRYLPTIDRVLYLDGDILVQDDLGVLARLNLENKALAGVLDAIHFGAYGHLTMHNYRFAKLEGLSDEQYQQRFSPNYYINSGVILLNLTYWRTHQLADEMMVLLRRIYEQGQDYLPLPKPGFNNQALKLTWAHDLFPDQDVINYILAKRNKQEILFLPNTYNLAVEYFHQHTPLTNEQPDAYTWLRHLQANTLVVQRELIDLQPKIWHFTGAGKPWHSPNGPLAKLYQEYAKLVNWGIEYRKPVKPNIALKILKAVLPYGLVRYKQRKDF